MSSNPFLELSRTLNVKYGLVLSFADAYERGFKNLSCWEKHAYNTLQPSARSAVIEAVNAERIRRIEVSR